MEKVFIDKKKFAFLFLYIAFLFLIYWVILFYFPLSHQIGLAFRYDMTSISIFILVTTYFLFMIKGRYDKYLFISFFVLLSALPLSGLWASGQSEPYILMGLLPFSDASGYYTGAQSFLAGGHFSGMATYRPISPAIVSLLLRITHGNLQITLAIQTVLIAFIVAISILFIRDSWGNLTATLFTLLIYFFWRPFIGTLMTENFGLVFGILGFIFLLLWSKTKKNVDIFIGSLFLCLGLNIRAGAYFIIICILVLLFIFKKDLPQKTILVFILSLFFVWVINSIVSLIYSGKIVGFSSNVFDNLYQLVTNSNSWKSLKNINPSVDTNQTRNMLELIFNELLKDPSRFLKSIANAYREYFSIGRSGLFGFIEGERIHTTRTSVLCGTVVLCFLSIVGIIHELINLIKKRDLTSALILFGLCGIVLSAPILYPGDYSGMRFFAATMGFQIIIPCIGLNYLLSFFTSRKDKEKKKIIHPQQGIDLLFSCFLLFVILVGLLLNSLFRSSVELSESKCKNGTIPVQVIINNGTFVNVITNDSIQSNYIPFIKESRAKQSSHGLSVDFSSDFDKLSAPFTLFEGIDLNTMHEVFVVFETNEMPEINRVTTICTEKSDLAALEGYSFVFSEAFYNSNINN